MSLLEQDIADNTDLMQVLKSKGMIADGQVGKALTQALLKTFPLEKSEQGEVSLESQQLDYANKVGVWQALTHQNKINGVAPGGLFYVTDQKSAGVKDMVRFQSALCEMTKEQTNNSFLLIRDLVPEENKNPFAEEMVSFAKEYGVRVGTSPAQYLDSKG